MFKFFSSLFKNKKLFIFAFFVLLISGIILPKNASAQSGFTAWALSNATWLSSLASTGISGVNYAIGDKLADIGKAVFNAIIGATGIIMILITNTLVALSSQIFTWVKGINDVVSYTKITGPKANPAIVAGWPMVRDLANMFVVLGFVIIGTATILRFKEYEAKKLLPKLIIAALLINFSLLICGIFIDGSNIAITHFFKSGGALEKSIGEAVKEQTSAVSSSYSAGGGVDLLGRAVGIVFGNIMISVVFFLFAFLFLARYLVLWILVILSPIAFVCYVFPFTKKYADMWWSNFFGWCIIGIPAGFFVWLSENITTKIITNSDPTTTQSGNLGSTLAYLLPGLFLIIGFLVSLQTSAMGAGAAVGAAKWSGGKLMGAGAGGALRAGRLADRATGGKFSEWSDKSKQKIARISETLGGKTGSAAQTQQARNTDAEKTVDALLSAPAGSKDRLRGEQLVKTGRGALGAAAVKKANEMGELSDLLGNDMNKIDQRSTFAGQFGHAKKQFEDKNPFLAGMDPQKVEKERVTMGLPNTTAGRGRAQSSLRRKAYEKNWKNLSTAEIANIDLSSFYTDDAKALVMGKHGIELLEATRSLPAGNTTRIHNRNFVNGIGGVGGMVGANLSSAQPDLDLACDIDIELDKAFDAKDVTKEREEKRRRNAAKALL
jgi:hypothetical protein